MKALYEAPQSDLDTNTSVESFNNKLYKISGIGLATFMGTPIAGGFLLSRNYKNMGKKLEAKKAIIYSILGSIVLFIVIYFIPESWDLPNSSYTVPQIVLMVMLAKQFQESDIDAHISSGGELFSNWRAFGISILIMLAVLTLIVPMMYFNGELDGVL